MLYINSLSSYVKSSIIVTLMSSPGCSMPSKTNSSYLLTTQLVNSNSDSSSQPQDSSSAAVPAFGIEYSHGKQHSSGSDDLTTSQFSSSDKNVESYYQDIFTKLPYNTQRAYISDYNEFTIFCKQAGLSGFKNNFEHNEICIKQYVEALCRSPLAYRTIKRRLSALSKFLGVAKLPNPIIRSAYLRDFIR